MKQKLIDSNNIEYHKVWIETSIEGQHDGCIMAYKNQIDSLPAVEAIPVEWIKERACRFDSPEAKDLIETLSFRYVLNTWREENGSN